jgi:thioredoxin-related protein
LIARGQNLPAGGCFPWDVELGNARILSLDCRRAASCDWIEIDDCFRVKTSRLLLVSAAVGGLFLTCAQAEPTWHSDFSKAQAAAKADHKLLLLDFTGSDWCIWCKKLEAEVFSQPEFQKYAADHLVLMTVDFPRAKPLAAAVRKQNEELAQKYGIEGFPTVVVLNSDGKQVGELGYEKGGANAFLSELKKLAP